MNTRRNGFTCPMCGSDKFGTFTNTKGFNKNYLPETKVGYCKENHYSGNGCCFQWMRDDPVVEGQVMYQQSFEEHMQQYKEITKLITKDDIGINNLVGKKIPNYRRDREPSPPTHLFKHCCHFWVASLDMDNRIASPRILEWNPVKRTWHTSGEVAIYTPPLSNMKGCVILGAVEVPEFPFSFENEDLQ